MTSRINRRIGGWRRIAGWRLFVLAFLFAVGLPAGGHADGEGGGIFRLEIGNEDRGILEDVTGALFEPLTGGGKSDGHLTWAWRMEYTPNETNPGWFHGLREYLVWIDNPGDARASYALEQDAITPRAGNQDRNLMDRPHAGFLMFNIRVGIKGDIDDHLQRIDSLDLTLGVVGPASGAGAMHRAVHGAVGTKSREWHQIGNEPVLNLDYVLAERILVGQPGIALNLELMPHVGAALGNAMIFGDVGVTVRVGHNLYRDSGALRLRPLLSGTNFPEAGDYFLWNLFLGVEGRVVARNIFLDGNTFRDSYEVDKKFLVYDIQAGAEIGYGGYRLSAMNVYRSPEFEGQDDGDQFVRVGLSMEF